MEGPLGALHDARSGLFSVLTSVCAADPDLGHTGLTCRNRKRVLMKPSFELQSHNVLLVHAPNTRDGPRTPTKLEAVNTVFTEKMRRVALYLRGDAGGRRAS